MAKRKKDKRTKNDLQNSRQKSKDRAARAPTKNRGRTLGASEG
jgi:hypothetical protein